MWLALTVYAIVQWIGGDQHADPTIVLLIMVANITLFVLLLYVGVYFIGRSMQYKKRDGTERRDLAAALDSPPTPSKRERPRNECRSASLCTKSREDGPTDGRRTATMKLTTTTQVSVDGVMQGPGGPEEDERGVFERGGWAHFDNEAGTVMDEIYQRADAFLFGRRTYEIFAGSWGTWDDPGDSPIWTALNTKPKYVASTTLTDPRWANTTVLSGDLAAAVRELKAKPGRELQVHGSGALFRWLLDNDLVDEMNLFTFPVVVGQGTRLFPDTGRDRALELVGSRATPSGVTIQVYRPTGRPQYGTATVD